MSVTGNFSEAVEFVRENIPDQPSGIPGSAASDCS